MKRQLSVLNLVLLVLFFLAQLLHKEKAVEPVKLDYCRFHTTMNFEPEKSMLTRYEVSYDGETFVIRHFALEPTFVMKQKICKTRR